MIRVLVWAVIPPIPREVKFGGWRASKMHISHLTRERQLDGGCSLDVAKALSCGTTVINHGFNGFGSDCIGCQSV